MLRGKSGSLGRAWRTVSARVRRVAGGALRRWRRGAPRSARAREIETELARHLVRQAPSGFLIGLLAAIAVVAVLRHAAPAGLLALWLGILLACSTPAFVVVWRFGRAADVGADVARWRRALTVAYGAAGAGWGALAFVLYPHLATHAQLFVLFIIGGSGVSGMAALAPLRPAFVAYLTTTFGPMIAVLVAGGPLSSIAIGLLCAVFWLSTISLASHLHALFVRSLELRFDNLELIASLSVAKDEAEAASRTKSVLLANVSHELRTPLALILGPTRRLLTEETLGDRAHRELAMVERNAQALLKHVNDLLDVAKLEAGRMEIERARVDVGELVRRTASLFDVVAHDRGVRLVVDASAPLVASVDAAKLERVLLNLLSNAMKFVPDRGRVGVAAHAEDGAVVLVVEDDGPGVPAAMREAIFERFRRGDDAAARRWGGTGLGLAIAREIVERHGGRITAGESAAGGALFRVTIPVVDDAAEAALPAVQSRLERGMLDEVARQTVTELRARTEPATTYGPADARAVVLVVEDNPEMSRFLAECLAADYRVFVAFDGRQALERALELRPDLILSDVMMPVMGGDALVRELRTYPGLTGIPIVVLTAKADDALRVRLLREGAQDFLTKPVVPEELRARVANLVVLKRTRDVLQRALSSQSRDLRGLADQLATANRAKDEFLAMLSHELRTPLTPILTWSSLLRDGRLDAQTVQHGIRAIERNAGVQARIIDDLLDVSRAISGKLALHVRPTALDPVILAAVEALRSAAEAKGVAVDVVPDPDLTLVSADPERLQQVVWNLVANAVKFTGRGGRVEVRSSRAGDEVRLVVADTGAGIDAGALPRLFERFWQADSSPTRDHGGLGLGLAVVRHLVELHGGTVRAESAGRGRGARFVVTLPALPIGAAEGVMVTPADVADAALQGLKVLVVDDDEDTCETLRAVLAGAGADVHTAASARHALTDMETWTPDILLSDIGMPGEDGYTLIRKVRARRPEEGGRVKAVALTAYGRIEDRQKALSAGYELHVGKPVEPHRLVNLVATLTRHGAPAAP